MKNYWTKSKVDKLSNMWAKGVPAREIADKLGNVSRNAVIGKANRLGLSKKAKKQEITPGAQTRVTYTFKRARE